MKNFKTIFNFLVAFLLLFSSLFAQWADLPKQLHSAPLSGINLSYPSVGNEGLFAGNFLGTTDGTINSPGVIKFNSSTQTFSAVSGFSQNEVKGFFTGPGGIKYAYGDYGIKKFNGSGTSASLEFSSTGAITAAWYFSGTFLVYGPNLTNLNGTPVNKVAKIIGTTVTSLPDLVPTGGSANIYNIRDDGSDFIILGDFTALGSINTVKVGIWDGINVFSTTGIPSNGYVKDLENSILGHSQGPMGFAGSGGYPLSGPLLKSEDVVTASDGTTWVSGSKISGGPDSRIYSWNGSWNNKEGSLINTGYQSLTNITFYGMVPFPGCMVVFGNFSPPRSHCTWMAQTCAAPPLAVKLSSFEGRNTSEGNLLSWSIESQKNNSGFEIQHSVNGIDFKKIEFLESDNSNNYSFLDKNPENENYYRLKSIDHNGQSDLSEIIFLKNDFSFEESIYPNPTEGLINIETKETNMSVRDMYGKIVLKLENFPCENCQLDISNEPKGLYFVTIGKKNTKIMKN